MAHRIGHIGTQGGYEARRTHRPRTGGTRTGGGVAYSTPLEPWMNGWPPEKPGGIPPPDPMPGAMPGVAASRRTRFGVSAAHHTPATVQRTHGYSAHAHWINHVHHAHAHAHARAAHVTGHAGGHLHRAAHCRVHAWRHAHPHRIHTVPGAPVYQHTVSKRSVRSSGYVRHACDVLCGGIPRSAVHLGWSANACGCERAGHGMHGVARARCWRSEALAAAPANTTPYTTATVAPSAAPPPAPAPSPTLGAAGPVSRRALAVRAHRRPRRCLHSCVRCRTGNSGGTGHARGCSVSSTGLSRGSLCCGTRGGGASAWRAGRRLSRTLGTARAPPRVACLLPRNLLLLALRQRCAPCLCAATTAAATSLGVATAHPSSAPAPCLRVHDVRLELVVDPR